MPHRCIGTIISNRQNIVSPPPSLQLHRFPTRKVRSRTFARGPIHQHQHQHLHRHIHTQIPLRDCGRRNRILLGAGQKILTTHPLHSKALLPTIRHIRQTITLPGNSKHEPPIFPESPFLHVEVEGNAYFLKFLVNFRIETSLSYYHVSRRSIIFFMDGIIV